MAFWIFKLAKQDLYPDVPGADYVYDNTHSVRVRAGDVFLYLDKRTGYAFTATGIVERVTEREPTSKEAGRDGRIRAVFTAHLSDVIWFRTPLSISPASGEGRANRARLGIEDVNLLGWSQSMPRLGESMYQAIMGLAEAEGLMPEEEASEESPCVEDTWTSTRIRRAISRFQKQVLDRHGHTCVVCGTGLRALVDAAHLSPYAVDKRNRANPANGVCLCTYCHRALDRRLIAVCPDGQLLVDAAADDPVAREHFTRVSPVERKEWLRGVSPEFLMLTVKLFREASSGEAGAHSQG